MESIDKSDLTKDKNKNIVNDIFTRYQWKQGKDGRIYFLQTSSVDTENKNKDQEILEKELEALKYDSSNAFKNKLQKKERAERTFDNTDKFKLDKFVITEWGLGKIVKRENQIITVDIYGNPAEFAESAIKLNYSITILVLIHDNSYLLDLKVDSSTTINKFKRKIADIVNTHSSLIVLVHGGKKVEDERSILELGIYDKDSFMAIVKDPTEIQLFRMGNSILNSKYKYNFNAVKFKCDEDIILSGLGFYKNDSCDVLYDLHIYEERQGIPHLILNEKKILILKKQENGEDIFKHCISHLTIKKNTIYQIHQNILNTDINSQYSGVAFQKEIESRHSKIKFVFYDCNLPTKTNGSTAEKGLIPSLYYFIKTEDDL